MSQPTPAEIEALPYRPCVGIMLTNAQGDVFVGQRVDREDDAWQMPQGGIDAGETPREAALRELREEVGLRPSQVEVLAETDGWLRYDLPAHLVPRVWGGRFRGQEQKWFLMRYEGGDEAIDLDHHHREFSTWRWIDPARLPDVIVAFKRPIYEQVVQAFAETLRQPG